MHAQTEDEINKYSIFTFVGGLCGMAAMFKAATDTVLTRFQVAQMSFDEVKDYMAKELDIESVDAKKMVDFEFLGLYYDCKYL